MLRALPYSIGSLLLVTSLILYCELGSVFRGLPSPGLQSSAPWALQVAVPWIIIGAVAAGLGTRIVGDAVAMIRSGLWIGGAVLGIAALGLLGETLLRAVSGVPRSLRVHLRARTCIHRCELTVGLSLRWQPLTAT